MTEERMTLEDWRISQGLSYLRLAQRLGLKTSTAARRYCLPVDHKNYRHPGTPELRRLIREMTDGQVVFD